MGLATAAGLSVLASGAPARACGGFFCDRPQANAGPPIAQAGENVLFALDRDPVSGAGLVEAHIQIKYTGAADQFSWVVPISSLPTIGVGTDVLFQLLEPKTRPTFTLNWSVDGTCQGQGTDSSSIGCGGSSSASSGASHSADAGAVGGAQPTVDVAFRGNVGPYDVAIVKSDDPTALETWLTDNQYFVSPDAATIIDEYVATQNYFVALRLQSGKDVDEIQPVVLKFTAEEGCIPLRLTAIAATPDVRINVWVLGAARAVPIGYQEFSLDEAKVDWIAGGGNYDAVVSDAANEAGGNAFLTEYAQATTAAVSWFTVPGNAVTLLRAATTPATFVQQLQALGLPLSGRVIEVLREQLPEPASLVAQGVTEAQFYAALGSYTSPSVGGTTAFSPSAAADAIDSEVLQPMANVRPLFVNHPTLTRLATFISPDEMTKDPLFVVNPSLPDVSNLHTAQAHVLCGDQDHDLCSAPVRVDVAQKTSIVFAATGGGYCSGAASAFSRGNLDTDLPAAEQSWQRDATSAGTPTIDNSATIAAVLRAHNAQVTGGGTACAVARTRRLQLPGLLLLGALYLLRARRRR
ncbi:MAG TPA: DUF2330 domain-containing protein [Polyangia bacterium]